MIAMGAMARDGVDDSIVCCFRVRWMCSFLLVRLRMSFFILSKGGTVAVTSDCEDEEGDGLNGGIGCIFYPILSLFSRRRLKR